MFDFDQTLSEIEIFSSPILSNFAVECDVNSKISQTVQNFKIWFFFEKKLDGIYLKKNDLFQNR